jgi:hypothetical protein
MKLTMRRLLLGECVCSETSTIAAEELVRSNTEADGRHGRHASVGEKYENARYLRFIEIISF